MRPVYVVSGGVSKFAKARPDKTFPGLVKEAYDYALCDLGIEHSQFFELMDGSVASYFSDHFTRQLMAGIMVQDYLGLCPKPVWDAPSALFESEPEQWQSCQCRRSRQSGTLW